MAGGEIGIGRFAAAHAIEEVLRMINILRLVARRFYVFGFGPELALLLFNGLRTADWMAANNFSEGIDRVDLLVGHDVEAVPAKRHRSFRPHERERAHAG